MFTRSKPQRALPQPPEELAKETPQPSIDHVSFMELKAFHQHVGKVLAQKEAQARLDFKRDFVDRMSALGLTLEDLKPEKPEKPKKPKKPKKERKKRDVPIKYRDPDNPENIWTGVGKPNRWLQEKLDQGNTLDQFAIAGDKLGESAQIF